MNPSDLLAIQSLNQKHAEQVRQLAERLGYGFVIDTASRLWHQKDPKGAFVVGPCAASTVRCPADHSSHCDWCCGSGWVTKKVYEVIITGSKN